MTDSTPSRLLVVDDEEDLRRLLKRTLSVDLGCEVDVAANAFQAMALIESQPVDVMLLDIRMPGMDGMEFLAKLRAEYPDLTVVMVTGHGSIDVAVEAIKRGAYDFLTKPFDHARLLHLLTKALERSRLVRENLTLQRRVQEQESFQEMVGVSPKMMKVFEVIRLVSKTDATVLITGESGTGKELAAKAIHRISHRAAKPYVTVNCPNLPENILESELFGYRRGAFTHATQDKKGLFWEAQGGTIFLDEIGDISPTLQTKLLRVLQEKEIRPLGDTRSFKVDARVIASTNQDLSAKIADKTFREDLFYRLNVLSVHMPALRDRPEDVPILAEHFLRRYCAEFHKQLKGMSPELMERLLAHPWRGNVRELENVIRRAIIMSSGPVITASDMDWPDIQQEFCLVAQDLKSLPYKQAKSLVLDRFHQEYISGLLTRNDGNVTRAAKDCGLERQALQQVMRRYGIKSRDFQDSDENVP